MKCIYALLLFFSPFKSSQALEPQPVATMKALTNGDLSDHGDDSFSKMAREVQQALVSISQSLKTNHGVVQKCLEEITARLAVLEGQIQEVVQKTEKCSEATESRSERTGSRSEHAPGILQQTASCSEPTETRSELAPSIVSVDNPGASCVNQSPCGLTLSLKGNSAGTPGYSSQPWLQLPKRPTKCDWHGQAYEVNWLPEWRDQAAHRLGFGDAEEAECCGHSFWQWVDGHKKDSPQEPTLGLAMNRALKEAFTNDCALGSWHSKKGKRFLEVVCVTCGRGVAVDYGDSNLKQESTPYHKKMGKTVGWPATKAKMVEFFLLEEHGFKPGDFTPLKEKKEAKKEADWKW